MFKKVSLFVLALLAVGAGVLYYVNGRDTYDPSKYSVGIGADPAPTATNGVQSDNEAPAAATEPKQGANRLVRGATVTFTLPDQFDKPHSVTPQTKTIIAVFGRSTGSTVREFLDKQGPDFLPKRDALFMADISPLPVVVRNTFALPMLRKSKYSVVLMYEAEVSKAFKNEDEADKITVATLHNGVVQAVKYVTTKVELEAALK